MHASRMDRRRWEGVLTEALEARLSELDLVLARLEIAAVGSPEAAYLESEERRLLRVLGRLALASAEAGA